MLSQWQPAVASPPQAVTYQQRYQYNFVLVLLQHHYIPLFPLQQPLRTTSSVSRSVHWNLHMKFRNDTTANLPEAPNIPGISPQQIRQPRPPAPPSIMDPEPPTSSQSRQSSSLSPPPLINRRNNQIHNDNTNPEQPQTPSNLDTSTNDYNMTSDDDSDTSNTTPQLLKRIDHLTTELELERDNNEQLHHNHMYHEQKSTMKINSLNSTINTLQQEIATIRSLLQRQQLQPNSSTTETSSTSTDTLPVTPQRRQPQQEAPAPPAPIAPEIVQILQNQQNMMSKHMQQTNQILSNFGNGIASLTAATQKSANAAEQHTQETIQARAIKGPSNVNRFPKFSNSSSYPFIDWYDDVRAILASSEWNKIYDKANNDAHTTTTDENSQLSEHLYSALRLALTSSAGQQVKSNEELHRNRGLEYLHSLKPIFHPKWAPAEHSAKMTEFYTAFRLENESIDEYTNKFRRMIRELTYNGVQISAASKAHQYLNGLGPEFIAIRTMATLPKEFQTTDIDELATASRDHLKRVMANRQLQKQQKAQQRQLQGGQSHDTPGAPSPSSRQRDNQSSQSRNGSNNPPPPRPDVTDWQKEIMREIGFRAHTQARKAYWQSLTQPHFCYFHRTDSHNSSNCSRMKRAMQMASSGSAPTSPFTPNLRFQASPTAPPPSSTQPTPPTPTPAPQQRPSPSTPAPTPAPRPPPPAAHTPTLRRVTQSNDQSEDDSVTANDIEHINNYNYDADYYPRILHNRTHSSCHSYTTTFVVDSGATDHMCNDRQLFTSIHEYPSPPNRFVKLGDGKTKIPIRGIGTIQYEVNNKIIILHNTLFVPDLDVSLYSIKQHMSIQGCYEHSENGICTIAYPIFSFQANIDHEITFEVNQPALPPNRPSFDNSDITPVRKKQIIPYTFVSNNTNDDVVNISSTMKTKPIKYVPTKGTTNSIGYDLCSNVNTSIPPHSRKTIGLGFSIAIPPGLYGRIAPRSSLALKNNIDVAAGVIDPDYRGEVKVLLVNSSQRKFEVKAGDKIAQLIFEKAASPAFKVLRSLNKTVRGSGGFGSTDIARTTSSLPSTIAPSPSIIPPTSPSPSSHPSPTPHVIPTDDIDETPQPTISTTHTPATSPTTSEVPLSHSPPTVRPIDKAQDISPSSKTITIEELRKLLGYRQPDTVLEHIHTCFQPNFHISNIDREPTLELGEIATIDKTRIPTNPVKLPRNFGDVMHVDIGYGCSAGIGGIKYALFVVDRATRYKYIYPIRSLTDDILPAFQSLVKDMGFAPKKIITDFDSKLFGQSIQSYFTPLGTTIESAPPRMQHKNGLVERNWRSVVRMARSWLTSALLPSQFWFHAIKRAVETTNYLPVTMNGLATTPFELVHHQKPDIRALIPLFSVAYIDHPRSGTTDTPTMSSQTLRVILIGKSSHSSALEFYHPPTKQIYSSSVYKLDPTLASGPIFDLHYDGGLFFNTYHNEADTNISTTFAQDQIVYFQPSTTDNTAYVKAKVIGIPLDDSTIYSIQRQDNLNIIEMPQHRLLPSNPTATPTNHIPINDKALPSWIKQNAAATLFLSTMPKPRRGLLKRHQDNNWYFHFGRTNRTEPVLLEHFHRDGLELIQQGFLIRGHPSFNKIIANRNSNTFKDSVARHVSAANLKNLDIPTLLQMQSMEEGDKQLWKQAYDEEFYGLEKLPAWTHISEKEYQSIRPTVGNLLPTMAISTIKYDENGKPKRCKWRIVALGNLDPHSWSNNDCFAPVLSTMEVRLLTSLAVHHKRTLKNGDIKQAFVQAVLPPNERYVLRPPPGCPNTPPNTYWLLKRTLYGLKRSPKHWFLKATELLKKCGLYPTPHNPCLFCGKPDGENIMYLGLYVDDLCYFSTSDACEREFERKLQSLTTVDFMGEVSHFLGLKFDWIRHDDGELDAFISQTAFAEQLIANTNLSDANPAKTPYRSGHPVDSVAHCKLTPQERQKLSNELRSITGSLLWLANGTRPDISTIVSMLAQHQSNPSYGHIRAAKHAIRYILGTKDRGITFSSKVNKNIQAFLNFPITPNTLLPLTDANWGGQDQGHNRTSITELERFKTRSMSGFIIFFNGPVHWCSKRQKITARSSAEAEIYATDECVKELLRMKHMSHDLRIDNILFPGEPINVYNDNSACVCWSKALTTKGLRHITIRENAIRESVDAKIIRVLHIDGKINIADIFTKEMKDTLHFITLCDLLVTKHPNNV